MSNRRNARDEAIEMGAALNMESTNEAVNYAIDDKVAKLKDHWEVVWEKVLTQKELLEQLTGKTEIDRQVSVILIFSFAHVIFFYNLNFLQNGIGPINNLVIFVL